MPMLNVALTGNIASGKSAVAALFRHWGATVIDADALVREVQAPGEPVLAEIAARFGAEMLLADGSLDRARLRQVVMADPAEREALNRIVHPAVRERRDALLAAARARGDHVVVSDIPLLFETADADSFDVVVLVDAPVEVRRARLAAHRGLAEDEAQRMIDAQLPSAVKRGRSDYLIENDGDRQALERAAHTVWRALLARA